MPQLPTNNLGQISQAKKVLQPTSGIPQNAAPMQPQVQPQMSAPEQQAQEQTQTQEQTMFTVTDYLKSKMLSFQGVDANGKALVEDMRTGKQLSFDPKEYIKSRGLDPNSISIQYNTPDEAVGESVYSTWERVKNSFGESVSTAGKEAEIAKLKTKYSEAVYNSKGELVVNDKGLWKPTDPNNWSGNTPWSWSEAFGDLADMAKPVTVGVGASMLAGPIGAATGLGMIGANVAGTAIAAGAANNIIGRALDTYKADPQQALTDISLDMVMTAAGMGVYKYGVVPPAKAISKAFGKLGSNMAEPAKEMFTKIYGGLTGKNPISLMHAINDVDEFGNSMVLKYADDALKQANGVTATAKAMNWQKADSVARSIPMNAEKGLERAWRSQTAEVLTAPGSKAFTLSADTIEQGMKSDWLKQGLGGLSPKTGEFIPLDDIVKTQMAKLGITPGPDDVVTKAGLTDLSRAMNDFFKNIKIRGEAKPGLLSGRSGLKRSLDLQKDLNRSISQIISSYSGENGSNTVVQAARQAKAHLEKQITDSMIKMSPDGWKAASAWQARNSTYSNAVGSVNLLKSAAQADDPRAMAGIVRALSGADNSQPEMKLLVDSLEGLLKPSEKGAVKEIQRLVASLDHMDYSAKTIQGSSIMNVVRGAAMVIPGGARVGDKIMGQGIKFIHNMNSAIKARAIKDPTFFSKPEAAVFLNSLYNSTMQGMSTQIKAQEMLKSQAEKATQKGE